jgi:hypothetical protein
MRIHAQQTVDYLMNTTTKRVMLSCRILLLYYMWSIVKYAFPRLSLFTTSYLVAVLVRLV